MDEKFIIEKTKLLAVEGKDEYLFFNALLKHLLISDVQLVDIGGNEKFQVNLPLLMNPDGFNEVTILGFIRDAESNPAINAFQGICGILKRNELPVPSSLTSFAIGTPKTGIYIMPDNQSEGMLENLCLKTLEGKPIESCIDNYMSCISPVIDTIPSEKAKFNEPKARVQTYLVSRAPVVNSLGIGAQKRYWDFNHPCFDAVKKFLTDLFG